MRPRSDDRGRPPRALRRANVAGALIALIVFGALASGGRPSGVLAEGPYSADIFDAQAESLLDGRIDVDPAVAGIEGFDHDDKTYVYFGLLPAVLRLPVVAATDSMHGRLTVVSMLAGLAVAMYASSRLLWRARRWKHPDDPPLRRWEPAASGLFVAAVGLASPLLFLGSRALVYHEVELWGTATTLFAIDRLLHWWEAPSGGRLVVASLAAAVAFNTRASVGGGAVAALAIVLALALLWRRVPARLAPALALAIVAPVLTYAAVNTARFDHPYAVPFDELVLTKLSPHRQAVVEATDGTFFGPEFAPSAAATYFRPDGVALQRLFPWVTFRESDTIIGDPLFDTVDRSASLPVVAPSFLALGAVGVGALLRRRGRDPWLAATAGAAMGLASTLTISFIANRYLADFVPTLVIPATIGLWSVGEALDGTSQARRRAAVAVLALVTAASAAISGMLAVQAQRLFLLPTQETLRGFVGLQLDVDNALGRGHPPDVSLSGSLPGDDAGQKRGQLHITERADGDGCRALHWYSGESWSVLEQGDDLGLELTGPIPSGSTELAIADTWRLLIDRVGDTIEVRHVPDAGSPSTSAARTLDGQDEDDHRILVLLDPVRHELATVVDGEEVFRTLASGLADGAAAGEGWGSRPNPTPLCDRLTDRLR